MATLTTRSITGCTAADAELQSVSYTTAWGTRDDASSTSVAYAAIDNAVTSSLASGDDGLTSANKSHMSTRLAFTDMPTDFSTMTTLSMRVCTALDPTLDDERGVGIAIWNSTETTLLAGYSTTATEEVQAIKIVAAGGTDWTPTSGGSGGVDMYGGTATAPSYNEVINFNYVNTTASKSDWDGALVQVAFFSNQEMAGDNNAGIVLVALELEGTYTQSSPPVTINPVGSTSASSSDTAQLTVTTPPVTVNPVKSTSASSSDTAQLTATYLPMTVNPVDSTSASSSNTAQLTVIGTINPVGSSSASSSDQAQLTVTWQPVTVNPVGSTSSSTSDILDVKTRYVYHSDDFNRPNENLDASKFYKEIGGNDHIISGNVLTSAIEGSNDAVTTFSVSTGGMSFVEADWLGTPSGFVGWFVDDSYVWQSSGNGYAFWQDKLTSQVGIVKFTNGNLTNVGLKHTPAVVTGRWRLEWYPNGDLLLYQNGALVLSRNDTAYTPNLGWVSNITLASQIDNLVFGGEEPLTTIWPVKSTSTSTSDIAQLTVTAGVTIDPVGSTSLSSSDTAQLTTSWQPMTVNPVDATSLSSSDVAQLTVTYLPMTVDPIGSTSVTVSDIAALNSPGTPTGVIDLAGVGGLSAGTVDLTWSEPVGVQ